MEQNSTIQDNGGGARALPDGVTALDQQLRRIAAVFYVVATVVGLLVANTPLGQGYHRPAINLLTPFALVSVLAIWYIPWQRYPRNLFAVTSFSSLVLGGLLMAWSGGWASPFATYSFFAVVFGALYFQRRLAMIVGLAATLLVLAPWLFGFAPPGGGATLVRLLLVTGTTHLAIVYVASAMTRQLVQLYSDSHARKAFEARLTYQAFHDPLTGLPNRARFGERLAQALARPGGPAAAVAVLFLDLDRFKVINDSLGHDIGDQLIVAVAGRLRACIRPGDIAARLGGDEFTVLLEQLPDAQAPLRVAERIMQSLHLPFSLDGHDVFITASIGIALGAAGQDQPVDLMRNADVALYRAKGGGKARYAVFDPGMNARALERLEMETALRRALERDEFLVYYQPKVELATGRIVGLEALLRWAHPEHGLVSPGEFIPLAEETGLILPVGRWVLMEACQQAQRWRTTSADGPPLTICVNLSVRQFQHPDLVSEIAQVLRQTGLAPARLLLEITESVVMEDAAATIGTLRALKGLGVELAIDDFGTGYSSLSYLKRFPVDILKIDKSFVDGLGHDPEDTAIVGAVITLAHALGLAVIAEGVETAEQQAQLQALECEMGQGYYFAKPLSCAAVDALLAEEFAAPAPPLLVG